MRHGTKEVVNLTQAEISAQVGVQVATAMTTTLVPIIKGKLNEKQDAEDGKGLSTEDYTTAEKNKLAGIASGAEVNIIDSITVNSTAATVSNKTVALTIPTKVSDISNDSGFQTAEQVEASIDAKVSGVYRASESATLATLPTLTKANLGRVSNMTESFTTTADFVEGAGITFPLGTNVVIVEALGGGYKYDVLAGFVDLSGKQDKLTVTGAANKGVYVSASGVVSAMTYEVNANVPANFAAASVTPLMDGTAVVGLSMKYAREDHVHPSDTNKVDKVTGKGLSTNDYTDVDKDKLSSIEAQANKTIIDDTLSNTGQAADAKTTGDSIAELRSLLSRMEIYCNASGNPAIFSDAAADDIQKLRVTITPTQSGSGDPYPPGGGKNLVDFRSPINVSGGNTSSLYVHDNNGIITFNGTTQQYTMVRAPYITLPAGSYVVSGGGVGTGGVVILRVSDNVPISSSGVSGGETVFTLSEETEINVRIDVSANVTINNLIVKPMVRHASVADSTWAPYTNVRPISGVSSVTVTRTGKNLFDAEYASGTVPASAVTISNGAVTINYTGQTNDMFDLVLKILPVPPGTRLVLSGASSQAIIRAISSDWTTLAEVTDGHSAEFTLPDDCKVRIRAYVSAVTNTTIYPMIRFASDTDPRFEPYRGSQSATVPLVDSNSNPLTVYGGLLDVKAGTLSVTHGFLSLNTADMDNGEDYPGWKNSGIRAIAGTGINKSIVVISNIGTTAGVNTLGDLDILWLNPARYHHTQSEWIQLALTVQFVIPLANPVTYQLTPQQLATLSGYNAVSSDAGAVGVTYKADASIIFGGG